MPPGFLCTVVAGSGETNVDFVDDPTSALRKSVGWTLCVKETLPEESLRAVHHKCPFARDGEKTAGDDFYPQAVDVDGHLLRPHADGSPEVFRLAQTQSVRLLGRVTA